MMNTDLIKYYNDRAKEYEKIYLKPERQEELITITKLLQEIFTNKNLIEIACGTGYWTDKIAQTATSIVATDINESVLEVAKQKQFPKANVTFSLADVFSYASTTRYDAIFGGFIWSHIKKNDLGAFLNAITPLLLPNATIVLVDNNFVEGSNQPLAETDEFGNTFQTRTLADGTSHLILKNFPTETYVRQILKEVAQEIRYVNLTYYWIVIFTVKLELTPA